jgi:soluble lytic murein transglycosylase-like protein
VELLAIAAVIFLAWRFSQKRQAGTGGGSVDYNGSPLPTDLSYSPAAPPADTPQGGDAGSELSSYGLGAIVKAVQHFESGGRQYNADGTVVTSSAGAIGIMQLEPATAAQLGVDPYDEQQNITGGTNYLQQLRDKYGNWFDALAAYVWGPGKVDDALAAGEPFPDSVYSYSTGVIKSAGITDDGTA